MNGSNDSDDCKDDLREIDYHIVCELDRISQFQKKLLAHSSHLRPPTLVLLDSLLGPPITAYTQLHNEISAALSSNTASNELKHRASDTVRTLQGITGALLVSADWQSPSFDHSITSQAGSQTGKITGTFNDYKLDQHGDGVRYEHEFRNAYIDAAFRIPPNVFLTSSGMSAFTTIVNSLHLDGIVDGPVLAGLSCYFECKLILQNFFSGNLFYVDEMDVDGVLAAVKELRPAVIFLDTLCNTETITLPDLKQIITRLAAEITRPTTLVLDNTGLGISCQPLKDLPLLPGKLRIIVFESLLKYHQFGMDRVTGGIMWTHAISPYGLSGWRMHLGTNMPDASVCALPQPNRALLTKRMARMNRNALYIAQHLDAHIKNLRRTPFSHIVYPGLESYPGYAWTQHLEFQGSFLVLACKSDHSQVILDKMFISVAVDEAKKCGIDLVAGTSFGFTSTRVYLTALHSNKTTQPFLRISVGTETKSEIERLAAVFTTTIDIISKRFLL